MLMRFIGQTSMNFVHGCEYDITSEIRTLYTSPKGEEKQLIYVKEKFPDPRGVKRNCAYTNIETFLENWDKVKPKKKKERINILCQ